MEKSYQWVAVGLGVVLLIILWLCVPAQKLQAKGILLPTGVHSSQIVEPSNVSLVKSMPLNAKKIGAINIERSLTTGAKNKQAEEIITKAKNLAAAAGANQIVLQVFFHTAEGAEPSIWIFRGVAIENNQPPLALQPGIVMPPSY